MLARLVIFFNVNVEKGGDAAVPVNTTMSVAVAAYHASQPGTR
jgi:hypothetical protein